MPHCHRNSSAIWDHTVLPVTWQRWHSRLYPCQLNLLLHLATLEGWKAELTLLSCLHWVCTDWQVNDEIASLVSGSSHLDELTDKTNEHPIHGFSSATTAHASHSCGTGELSHSVNNRCWHYINTAVRGQLVNTKIQLANETVCILRYGRH